MLGNPDIQTPTICADVQAKDLRQLAAVVILQAVADVREAPIELRLDALLWLTGPDFGWWAEAADLPFADPLQMLGTGIAGKIHRRRIEEVEP